MYFNTALLQSLVGHGSTVLIVAFLVLLGIVAVAVES